MGKTCKWLNDMGFLHNTVEEYVQLEEAEIVSEYTKPSNKVYQKILHFVTLILTSGFDPSL